MREAMSSVSHDMPSTRPSPVTALHDWIIQCRFSKMSAPRSKDVAISSLVCAPARSCLLAKISREAPASFWRQGQQ